MSSVAVPSTATAARTEAHRPGVRAVYRWELRKLIAQKRTFIGLGAAVAVPLIFVIALLADGGAGGGGPNELPFSDLVRETGFAVPLVSLAFGAFWLLPLITALVAGDIVATEDHNGTLKTILTRSVDRWQVFAGKVLAALTYTAAVLFSYVGIALVAGGLVWGFDPLTTLSGTQIGAGRALVLTGAGTLAYLLPLGAIAAIGILLSTVTRNSAAAVVGTLMVSIFVQIIGSISALDALDPYLLSTQFNAWQGILREPTDWDPIIRSAWVCALYAVPALAWAFTTFLRRDVTGG
jgi:ABC-2 type transport system permease protein